MKLSLHRLSLYGLSTLLLLTAMVGCRNVDYIESDAYDNDDEDYDESLVDLETYPSWSKETHSNAVEPNYTVVFAEGEVMELNIIISSSSWSSMLSDLATNYRYINSSESDYTPLWQPCTVTLGDTDWYEVGVRFKGNSSLSQTYSSGNRKLSLKLDFDQYEDDFPALTNQRFYGFKQLNLNNNYDDESLMREKVGADLFRAFGLASARTRFCAVNIDTGSGFEYYGIYTIVEEVDDTVIDTQFSSGSGNLYKPDGDAASFKSGTYDTSEFYLKTNTSSPDYSDVKALYDAVNSSDRTSDSATWCNRLESVFCVDSFLRWMAANAVIQNWDTYGNMTHNYFLYNNPENGLLTWIPWDNNEAFQSGSGEKSPIEMNKMGSVSSSWPLIKYIYAVSEYQALYESYLQKFADEVFITADLQSLYTEYYNLLKEYAYAEQSGRTFLERSSDFDDAVDNLKTHAQTRNTYVNNYLK
ncbi:MAG: CotH kinase family protein [Rikenellaceae bacterium]